MNALRLFLLALILAAGQAHAQTATPAEIAFWESVRDTKNPEELRAYLQTFPNGMFAPLARARLAALEKPPAVRPAPRPFAPPPAAPPSPAEVASTAPASVTAATRMPQAGDTWVYRVSYPRLRGQFGQPTRPDAIYVVKVGGVNDGRIVDQFSVDGGTMIDTTHSNEAYVVSQGLSVFSPYLIAFRDLQARPRLGDVKFLEPACSGRYGCDGSARVLGNESVQVPAGRFNAIKVSVTHEWRGAGVSDPRLAAQMIGGRTLTIWYVPELKRAVKFSSRLSAGDVPAVESNFDLELVSYQVR